jgi:FtsZ-binding cell division protein ZapB
MKNTFLAETRNQFVRKRVSGFFLFYQTNVNFVLKNLAMSDPNPEIIVELQRKVERLIDKHQGLKAEVRRLSDEKDRLLSELDASARNYEALETKYNNLKLTKDLMSSPEQSGDTKKRINQIVREIDKCIALLNR